MNVEKRQEIERKVVRHLIREMKKAGWSIAKINDGGEPDEDILHPNETEAMDTVFSVDESTIYFSKGELIRCAVISWVTMATTASPTTPARIQRSKRTTSRRSWIKSRNTPTSSASEPIMQNVQVTQVTLSEAGLRMLILDNEKQENAKIINRLQNEIAEKQRRLRSLKKRQEEIALAEFQANQLTLPGLQ